jgi:hypothetical protein
MCRSSALMATAAGQKGRSVRASGARPARHLAPAKSRSLSLRHTAAKGQDPGRSGQVRRSDRGPWKLCSPQTEPLGGPDLCARKSKLDAIARHHTGRSRRIQTPAEQLTPRPLVMAMFADSIRPNSATRFDALSSTRKPAPQRHDFTPNGQRGNRFQPFERPARHQGALASAESGVAPALCPGNPRRTPAPSRRSSLAMRTDALSLLHCGSHEPDLDQLRLIFCSMPHMIRTKP